MKKIILKKITLLLLGIFFFSSCSSDSDNDEPENQTPEYAMTFKLNGELFEINNPYGTNEFSPTNVFSAYPIEDYVLLQARNGLFGLVEIDLWLERDLIMEDAVFQVGEESDESATHINLIDNRNNFFESTTSGEVSILTVDTTNKIVTGTFEFTTQDLYSPGDTTINVTEGTFNFVYEE
ncbi:MAG: hypothetical protein CMC76_00010 [Flavobacteriaceae bacterium]|nr:hypothetical protein [Flavobacteriaceae bacterium]|tara:strand:+ start:715 stop:1254 length:540 start_codon:yes stop_codon:yes gene_type:complete